MGVERLLSISQRQRPVESARSFLSMCRNDSKPILESIVTEGQTMVLHYDLQSKNESMEWWQPDEPRFIKAKIVQSTSYTEINVY